MRQWLNSGIFQKIILSILVVSLVPQVVLGLLALRSISDAGTTSITRSREALDAKSTEALELRTLETARAIARFLGEREADLRTLAELPRTAEAYQTFSQAHQGEIWLLEDGEEVGLTLPLYREVTYVDATGQEIINVVHGQLATPSDLRDVSIPANTTYRSETYFDQARNLSPGEIYVGHVIGFYIDRAEFEEGERFEGVLRLAMPVFDEGEQFDGMVVLALDSRHLAEFTEHIVPTEERFAAVPDPSTGNYAYLIDNRSNTLGHPNDFYQWGVDQDGNSMPPATRLEDLGVLPVQLDLVGFADENLASIPALTAQGEAGSIQYNWQGHDKFAAYAPIPYYGGDYAPPGGFGWVGISADVATFHEAATLVGEAIAEKVRGLLMLTLTVGGITIAVVVGVAAILAGQIAAPIRRVTEAARAVERGEFELDILDPLVTRRSEDEIVRLARVFKGMAEQVHRREESLKRQVAELRIEVNEAKRVREVAEITETEYFQKLQQQAKQLRARRQRRHPGS